MRVWCHQHSQRDDKNVNLYIFSGLCVEHHSNSCNDRHLNSPPGKFSWQSFQKSGHSFKNIFAEILFLITTN